MLTPSEIKSLVGEYLALLRSGLPTPDENITTLEQLLDRLAVAQHDVTVEFDDSDHPDPPEWPHRERWAMAAKRFPDFGYYNEAFPVSENPAEAANHLGDAIDDIADIAGDLADVAWRWENTSEADALWHFSFMYKAHWGQHLRSLQRYLWAWRRGS